MNDSKIDFTSLDPTRDRARWEARIVLIGKQAATRRRSSATVTAQLLTWSRPMFAIAASVALVGWASFWAFSPAHTELQQDPATVLTNWAIKDEVPSPQTVILVLGGSRVDK